MAPCPSCGMPIAHNGPCPHSYNLSAGVKTVLQGRYELIGIIGEGGMGCVYMARDHHLHNRLCVVKKLRNDFGREEDREKAKGFFEREVGVLSRLEHPNIVHILDYFQEHDEYFLVMDYVEGPGDLHKIVKERGEPFDEDLVIAWATQICDVLDYLHGQKPPVIYRDLKPSNIMIDMKKQVKLVDFGIARDWEGSNENTHVVSQGYSPPEQYWGGAVPQSDIYALGATMYFLLTGKDPEPLTNLLPKLANPRVSTYTDALVARATAQEVGGRFPTASELREALMAKDYLAAPETTRGRLWEILVAVVLIVIGCSLYFGQSWLDPLINPLKIYPQKTDQALKTKKKLKFNDKTTSLKNPASEELVTHGDLSVQITDEAMLTDQEGSLPNKDGSPNKSASPVTDFSQTWYPLQNSAKVQTPLPSNVNQ